jgi:hypothetical protein
MQVPQDAWKPGISQDGEIQEDKNVAEITRLMSRAGNWPGGLRWIVRRVKPSRRQMRNLTAYEKKTGWRYSISCTDIPETGISGVPGSHHPQYLAAWTRLLGFGDDAELREADPDKLRYRIWRIPARRGRPVRTRAPPGYRRAAAPGKQTDSTPETGHQHNQ